MAPTDDGALIEVMRVFADRILVAADPLWAERVASQLVAAPRAAGIGANARDSALEALVEAAGEEPSAASAALVRALAAVCSGKLRKAAVEVLGDLTSDDFYPPAWAHEIGRAVPVAAWRRRDVYGDCELITVRFTYGSQGHDLVVAIDRTHPWVALDVRLMILTADSPDGPSPAGTSASYLPAEEISLAGARLALAPALSAADRVSAIELDVPAVELVALALARMRRLPKPAPTEPTGPTGPTGPTASGQRADAGSAAASELDSVVEAFVVQARALVPEATAEALRHWAGIFARYGASLPERSPVQVGPLTLSHLLAFVGSTFELDPEQRRVFPAILQAWTAWAGAQRGLTERVLAHLKIELDDHLADFETGIDELDATLARAYVIDLSTGTTDAVALREARRRRMMAVPPPGERTGAARLRTVDISSASTRREITENEFGDCTPLEGMSHEEFVAAVVDVSEQLWRGEPADLVEHARMLALSGMPGHDVLHTLVATASSGSRER